MTGQVPQAVLEALTSEGLSGESDAESIRRVYTDLTGDTLDDIQLQIHRKALREYQQSRPGAEPAAESEESQMATATKKAPKTTRKLPDTTKRRPAATAKAPKEPKAPKAPKEPKPAPEPMTAEQKEKKADKIMKEYRAAGRRGWDRVVKVTETSEDGRPLRVDIRCSEDGCKQIRNVAVQDVFQITRCVEHQKAAQRNYRNSLAKRNRAAKAAVAKPAEPKAAAKRPARKAAGAATA